MQHTSSFASGAARLIADNYGDAHAECPTNMQCHGKWLRLVVYKQPTSLPLYFVMHTCMPLYIFLCIHIYRQSIIKISYWFEECSALLSRHLARTSIVRGKHYGWENQEPEHKWSIKQTQMLKLQLAKKVTESTTTRQACAKNFKAMKNTSPALSCVFIHWQKFKLYHHHPRLIWSRYLLRTLTSIEKLQFLIPVCLQILSKGSKLCIVSSCHHRRVTTDNNAQPREIAI